MYIFCSGFIAVLAYGSTVVAAPAANTCNPVDAVYAILKGSLKNQASSFCLDFLGGHKTVQSTKTIPVTGAGRTVTITNPDQTQTANIDVTNVNRVTSTIDQTAANPTTTTTVTVTAGTRTIYQKRGVVPTQLIAFASSRISSACSCIVTPTTKTITNTQVQTVNGPQAIQTEAGRLVTVTVTRTVQITSEDTVTKTVSPAGTDVQTVATTVTPILVKPKICNAKGLPGPNAFNYDANFNTNQAACIASCKPDNRCLATGFYIVTDPSTGTQTGTCRKYDKSVTDSADLGFGYYNFNDKAC
ncbi:uncharacterized protein K460DRAFT_414920 [Cucurbitaria berberidis CBS 394.84]|uniref:Apple domain-containing protein n=1 Tax=Cucurbitaria berberidis CBS 394.84 TaxID=1168544 RepID=A0A9P4GNM9_9PLEO|nr:uncharacterized protein K460DRAFT_414920 [Cucurbitaria berberidis CBS 394.84]KAF1848351.1 hypothetical protein K460DRAFT_414920 [Cucurbitaria berberidis CBS 394.84]